MAAETFADIWRRAHLELPAVPPLLVRSWAQEAFTQVCDHWDWAFLRGEGTISIQAARTVTTTFTQGSKAITSTAGFLSTDAGRQIRVTRLPVYTIDTVTDASNAVLSEVYTEDSGAASATIQDCYATMPADFRMFLVVFDRYYQRVIPFWLTQDDIATSDPGHLISDTGPRYLVARAYSTATATVGQVQYEYWPAPTSVRTYPYLYVKGAQVLNDTDVLPGVFARRADVFKTYIRYQAAQWPGTTDLKNPAFSLAAAQLLSQQWEAAKQRLTLIDDNEYPQQLSVVNWARRIGAIAPTASLLRQTDATVADYI
jgi:hypothetical protein